MSALRMKIFLAVFTAGLFFTIGTPFAEVVKGIKVSPKNVNAGKRIALVIGNSAYTKAPLKNPVNDAQDLAAALRSLGFEVDLKNDVNKRQMINAIDSFAEKIKSANAALFYFSGHGSQIEGKNFLFPIQTHITSESDIELETVNAYRVLGKMETARSGINIVILDACRNNPYTRAFRPKGLVQIDAPKGTLIAYSTSPGGVALDGKGRNSPYTAALVKNIKIPELAIEQVFKHVRQEVDRNTKGKQTPWEASSLFGDFYFNKQTKAGLQQKQIEEIKVGLEHGTELEEEVHGGRKKEQAMEMYKAVEIDGCRDFDCHKCSDRNACSRGDYYCYISKCGHKHGAVSHFGGVLFYLRESHGFKDAVARAEHIANHLNEFIAMMTGSHENCYFTVLDEHRNEIKNNKQTPTIWFSIMGGGRFNKVISVTSGDLQGYKYRAGLPELRKTAMPAEKLTRKMVAQWWAYNLKDHFTMMVLNEKPYLTTYTHCGKVLLKMWKKARTLIPSGKIPMSIWAEIVEDLSPKDKEHLHLAAQIVPKNFNPDMR